MEDRRWKMATSMAKGCGGAGGSRYAASGWPVLCHVTQYIRTTRIVERYIDPGGSYKRHEFLIYIRGLQLAVTWTNTNSTPLVNFCVRQMNVTQERVEKIRLFSERGREIEDEYSQQPISPTAIQDYNRKLDETLRELQDHVKRQEDALQKV